VAPTYRKKDTGSGEEGRRDGGNVLSEFVGSSCHICAREWRSLSDFKRVRTYDAPFVEHDTGDIYPAVWTVIMCLICGAENDYATWGRP
jgi:hypothetical protein